MSLLVPAALLSVKLTLMDVADEPLRRVAVALTLFFGVIWALGALIAMLPNY